MKDPLYIPPEECITTESILEDKRRKRLKLYAKLFMVVPLLIRLFQEFK